MKNKEFYKDKIYEVACKRGIFAVNKKTGEVMRCKYTKCRDCVFDYLEKYPTYTSCDDRAMAWLEQEHTEPVLDDVEKRYLEGVLRPFKKRIKSIKKMLWSNDYTYIQIAVDCLWGSEYEVEYINLPVFVRSKMYKGMVLGKQYTIEELGLFK